MIAAGSRTNWQTTLADLALILFMVTAAAIAERPKDASAQVATAAAAEMPGSAESSRSARSAAPAQGEPMAIYRPAPEAPPLGEWLAAQQIDPRQHLTIVTRHRPGGAAAAARAALVLERAATAAGHSARIVVEPAETDDLIAVLDFDGRPPAEASGM